MTDTQTPITSASNAPTPTQPVKTPIVVYTEEQDTQLGDALASLANTTPTDMPKRTLRQLVHKYIESINAALQKGHTTQVVCTMFNEYLKADLNINTFRAYVAAENYVPEIDASGNPIPRTKLAANVVDTKSVPKLTKAVKPKAKASTPQAASPSTQAAQPETQEAQETKVVPAYNNTNNYRAN